MGESAKKLLYVLRTPLTGTHALRTGVVETDVTELLDLYGFSEAHALVEQKTRGEKSELPDELSKKWRAEVARSFEVLDAAMPESVLPEDPPGEAVDALEAWMLDLRRRRFDTPAR